MAEDRMPEKNAGERQLDGPTGSKAEYGSKAGNPPVSGMKGVGDMPVSKPAQGQEIDDYAGGSGGMVGIPGETASRGAGTGGTPGSAGNVMGAAGTIYPETTDLTTEEDRENR